MAGNHKGQIFDPGSWLTLGRVKQMPCLPGKGFAAGKGRACLADCNEN